MKLIIPIDREPDWGVEDKLFETPVNMVISAQITGLTSGNNYTVFKFESATTLPTKNFAASALWTKKWSFTPTTATHDLKDFDTIRSDQ